MAGAGYDLPETWLGRHSDGTDAVKKLREKGYTIRVSDVYLADDGWQRVFVVFMETGKNLHSERSYMIPQQTIGLVMESERRA